MKHTKTIVASLLAIAAIALLAGSVSAAGFNWVVGQKYWIDVQESGDWSWHSLYQGAPYANINGVAFTVPYITVYDSQTATTPVAAFWGTCIDTAQFVNGKHEVYLEQGWHGSDPSNPGTDTYPGHYDRFNGTVTNQDAWKRASWLMDQIDMSTLNTNDKKAGFQLAIWELGAGDGASGADFANGNFKANPVTAAQLGYATTYVATGFNMASSWTGQDTWYFHDQQDFMINIPGQHNRPPRVPEIPAGLLAPLGLAALAAVRRRFAK